MEQSETYNESETTIGYASIWTKTHTIYCRPVPENDPSYCASPSAASGKGAASCTVGCPVCCASSSSGAITRKSQRATGKSTAEKQLTVVGLTDAVSDLSLDSTLPGTTVVELHMDGKDISVTIHNSEQYLKVYKDLHSNFLKFNVKLFF